MESIKYLEDKGIVFKIIELSEIPKSAQDVERLFGCPLHQVLKTLVFIGDKEPVLATVPSDKKVDIEKLKKVTDQESLRMAKPDEVLEVTGYSIGGVTPFGIEKNVKKVIDKSVFDMDKVNIGSGKPEIGIEFTSENLKKAWEGLIENIVQ